MRIAFNVKTVRPGCALLQAAMGCDPRLASNFRSEYWELFPSPDLIVYEITEEQLELLQEKVERTHGTSLDSPKGR